MDSGCSAGLLGAKCLQNLQSIDDLMNLKTRHTKDVHTEEKYHEINNNTLNRENIKDVTTDIYNTQYGNRIQGRAYDLDNHYNAGYESFGLQNLKQEFDLQNLNPWGTIAKAGLKKGLRGRLQNLNQEQELELKNLIRADSIGKGIKDVTGIVNDAKNLKDSFKGFGKLQNL